jgi:phage gpG-like protein
MADNLVAIDFRMPDYLERYRQHFRRILVGIASDIQTNRGLLFDAEGAYNGHNKWQNLASGKNLKKAKNGLQVRQILRKTGTLKNSIGPDNPDGSPGKEGYVRFEGDFKNAVVKVGTNVAYARIHNEGGTIQHPGTDNGFGRGIKIKAHAIRIPKRNFTDWNDADAKNMKLFLKNMLDVLNGR